MHPKRPTMLHKFNNTTSGGDFHNRRYWHSFRFIGRRKRELFQTGAVNVHFPDTDAAMKRQNTKNKRIGTFVSGQPDNILYHHIDWGLDLCVESCNAQRIDGMVETGSGRKCSLTLFPCLTFNPVERYSECFLNFQNEWILHSSTMPFTVCLILRSPLHR